MCDFFFLQPRGCVFIRQVALSAFVREGEGQGGREEGWRGEGAGPGGHLQSVIWW